MEKKKFIEPTIEKVNFTLSDNTMCQASGVSSDYNDLSGLIGSQTGSTIGN